MSVSFEVVRNKKCYWSNFQRCWSPFYVLYISLFTCNTFFFFPPIKNLPMLKSIICFKPCKQIGYSFCTTISKAKPKQAKWRWLFPSLEQVRLLHSWLQGTTQAVEKETWALNQNCFKLLEVFPWTPVRSTSRGSSSGQAEQIFAQAILNWIYSEHYPRLQTVCEIHLHM